MKRLKVRGMVVAVRSMGEREVCPFCNGIGGHVEYNGLYVECKTCEGDGTW